MPEIRITTIQADLKWEDIDGNLAMFDEYLRELNGETDIVVLPEMFTTAFSMKSTEFCESMDGKTMNWLKERAKQYDIVITGSIIIKEDEKYYNRLIWMRADGTFEKYDKHQLFKMAGEHKHYTAGNEKLIVEHKGFRFCPLVCYDLRFPVWARNVEDYDILIYVANWPIARRLHWRRLLQARAIENQCYTIGVNRCGTDGLGYVYSGDTSVFAPYGEEVYHIASTAGMNTVVITKIEIERIREKIPYLQDRDTFEIK
jgi:predicted amidohydrolase